MATKQINFEIALKKGEIGETIIQNYLEKLGWVVYKPFTKDKAHYFDILATKDKQKIIAIDVKTKARLNKWDAQGINIKHYNEYIRFIKITNIPFYLIFVDDKNGDVHIAEIDKLKNGFRPTENIIAWYLQDMKKIFTITSAQIAELSKYDQRNYIYKPENKSE